MPRHQLIEEEEDAFASAFVLRRNQVPPIGETDDSGAELQMPLMIQKHERDITNQSGDEAASVADLNGTEREYRKKRRGRKGANSDSDNNRRSRRRSRKRREGERGDNNPFGELSSRDHRQRSHRQSDSSSPVTFLSGAAEGANFKTMLICVLGLALMLKLGQRPTTPSQANLATVKPMVRGALVVNPSDTSAGSTSVSDATFFDRVSTRDAGSDNLSHTSSESSNTGNTSPHSDQNESGSNPYRSNSQYSGASSSHQQQPTAAGYSATSQSEYHHQPLAGVYQRPGASELTQQQGYQFIPNNGAAVQDPNNLYGVHNALGQSAVYPGQTASAYGSNLVQPTFTVGQSTYQQSSLIPQQQLQPGLLQQGLMTQQQQISPPLQDPIGTIQVQIPGTYSNNSEGIPLVSPPGVYSGSAPAFGQNSPPTSPEDTNADDGKIPLHELSNFKESWDPYEKSDIPMFWHIPKAGGSSIKDAMGGCHRFVQATEFGVTDGHDQDTEVAIVYPKIPGGADTDRSPFVNVDATTVEGIKRAKSLGFADAGLADVVVSPFVYETNDLFTLTARGRLFSVFRHPIDRAISMFYYIQVAHWEPSYRPDLKDWTLEQYAQSDVVENNWMTRQLSNQLAGDLTDNNLKVAMEVVRRKFLVGLMTEIEPTMARFEKFFRWKFRVNPTNQEACRERLMSGGSNSNKANQKAKPSPGEPGWDLLAHQNNFDLQLYAYIEQLFKEQEAFVSGIPDNYRNIDATCCKCDPPTYPEEGFNCPQAVKNGRLRS